jgi:transcriptional regulator with XRE-family HTH domain
MDDNASIFWENVKKEIKAQNTTQEWVAKKSGISLNTFQGWIAKGIYPRANEAVRIAKALDTSVEYLIGNAIQGNDSVVEVFRREIPLIETSLIALREAVKKYR